MSTETNQRLLATLQMSRGYAKSARSLPVVDGAFCQASFGGAVLLYKAAELPDAAGELPPEHSLTSPPDLTPGYASLGLAGPVLVDGQRYFDWVERGKYHDEPLGVPPLPAERVLEWADVVRDAFERKYAKRLRP